MSNQPQLPENYQKPPHSIAFVLDGYVQDVIHVNPRLAALFLSNPIAVDVTGAEI